MQNETNHVSGQPGVHKEVVEPQRGQAAVNQTNKKKRTGQHLGRYSLPTGEKKKLIQVFVKGKNYAEALVSIKRIVKRYNK